MKAWSSASEGAWGRPVRTLSLLLVALGFAAMMRYRSTDDLPLKRHTNSSAGIPTHYEVKSRPLLRSVRPPSWTSSVLPWVMTPIGPHAY